MKHCRVRAGEEKLDRILLVHDVVPLQLEVGIRIHLLEFPLDFVHIVLQCLRALEIDDEFAVREGRRGNAPDQIVPGRCAAYGGRDVSDLRPALQPFPDFGQVLGHPGGVGTFWKLVFHIELVIDHVREETLLHLAVSKPGQSEKGKGDAHCQDSVVEGETERLPKRAVNPSVVETFLSADSLDFLILRAFHHCIGHQRYVHEGQNPAEKQRYGQHYEQIPDIDSRSIRREENRQE